MLATGGIGKAYEVTSNSWEYSGDGQALAYEAGADLIDMEFVQFHPTGMVWPPGVRGLLVTEAVRGEGGILRNAEGERFMWKYLPEDRRARVRRDRRGGQALGDALSQGRRRMPAARRSCSTRDNVARAIYTEVKEGRGSPHGDDNSCYERGYLDGLERAADIVAIKHRALMTGAEPSASAC